jgi:hypothetical protein
VKYGCKTTIESWAFGNINEAPGNSKMRVWEKKIGSE